MSRLDSIKQTVSRWPGGETGIRLVQRIQKDNATDLAAQVAYNLIFALPPLILFVMALAAFTDHVTSISVTEDLRKLIDQHAPGDAKALLDSMVKHSISETSGGATSFRVIIAILLAFWGAAGGIGALITAFNRAYEVNDSRAFIKKKVTTLGLTLLSSVLVIAAFVLFVFGQKIGLWITDRAGLGHAFTVVWNILRWPVAIIFILLVLSALYYFGPDIAQEFRWMTPGSVLATVAWVLAALGFKLYLAVSNPGSAYGAAGSVIVLLFFLYVTSLVFIVGAELNAVVQQEHDPKTIADLAHRRQPAPAAQTEHPARS